MEESIGYHQVRAKETVSEYLHVFNSVAVLHLLEQNLVRYDPESRTNIVNHLLKTWDHNIEARTKIEMKAMTERLSKEESLNEQVWGTTDKEEAITNMEKALQNSKASTFTIIDNTLNVILSAIEKYAAKEKENDSNNKLTEAK